MVISNITDIITNNLNLVIGLSAYAVYRLERRNEIKKSATIVLLAVRQAERTISTVKETRNIDPRSHRLVRGDPWSTHNHLLADHLDEDELELIDQFFKNCTLIDKMLDQLCSHPQVHERVLEIQRILCKIAYDSTINSEPATTAQDRYQKSKDAFLGLMEKEETLINPKDPQEMLRARLTDILPITTTTAGSQLKRLASRWWQRRRIR
ncbi:MAG: hypothetical protein K940chlam3_01591 [Chlamydiae bacterium]|nr:hypothetical protein [Chlamydiota bacterium]